MQNRTILILALCFGALAVAIGAFGAHALKPHFINDELVVFETASRYHFYHVLAALFVLLLLPKRSAKICAILFLEGIILFSGSLYLLAAKHILGIAHWQFLGIVTPFGGLFFIAGWVFAAYSIIKEKTE